MEIFVFRHGSRLLEDAVAALTSRNIPRSKAYGYVHTSTMRLGALRRHWIKSQRQVKVWQGITASRVHFLNATIPD
ncbi:hypothetical protein DIZ27_14360 [Streptomyces sp. NWU339]|nr:hypothetical protein DIZ27_14360 [Streptomyces sp. NWU339]